MSKKQEDNHRKARELRERLDGEEPGQVTEFSYLGGLITEGGQCTNDKKQCWPGIIQIGQDVED